jgi:hypothetical protein
MIFGHTLSPVEIFAAGVLVGIIGTAYFCWLVDWGIHVIFNRATSQIVAEIHRKGDIITANVTATIMNELKPELENTIHSAPFVKRRSQSQSEHPTWNGGAHEER